MHDTHTRFVVSSACQTRACTLARTPPHRPIFPMVSVIGGRRPPSVPASLCCKSCLQLTGISSLDTMVPPGWVCIPGCVCHTLDSARPLLDKSPWAALLRTAVHECVNPCSPAPMDWWGELRAGVRFAQAQGVDASTIAHVLSEVHVSFAKERWYMTLMSQAHNPDRATWLLDLGCCPNLGGGNFQAQGPPIHVCTARMWNAAKVLDLAGGVCATLRDSKGMCPPMPPRWLRYHGRPFRLGWARACVAARLGPFGRTPKAPAAPPQFNSRHHPAHPVL